MSSLRLLVYQGLAAIAMVVHLLLTGLFTYLTLLLSAPPGTEALVLVLKGVVVVSWLVLGWLGLFARSRRSWLVVGVPILSWAIVWAVITIGTSGVHWGLNWGY